MNHGGMKMKKLLVLTVLMILNSPFAFSQARGKKLRTASSLVGTTWKVDEHIVRWEESEMSPITFLAGGKVTTRNTKVKLVWKQTGNRVEIKDTEMGWPEVWATIKGDQMSGSARLGMSVQEFGWRAQRIPNNSSKKTK
jgi:hypothetical protein